MSTVLYFLPLALIGAALAAVLTTPKRPERHTCPVWDCGVPGCQYPGRKPVARVERRAAA